LTTSAAIAPVVVACVFEETEPELTRISLRSKSEKVNVNEIAAQFGGGGHPAAAGARISGSPSRRSAKSSPPSRRPSTRRRTKPGISQRAGAVTNCAKRLECAELAPLSNRPRLTTAASKLDALQTLRDLAAQLQKSSSTFTWSILKR